MDNLVEVFPEDFLDELFKSTKQMCNMSTQTEVFLASAGTCVERFCMNEPLRGRRCKTHHGLNILFKDGVKLCRMKDCFNEAYGRKYKCCEEHEIKMGNISSDIDFFSDLNFQRCIVKRCYRKATRGWRCFRHSDRANVEYKHGKITCYKENCTREIFGKGYTLCILHK